MQYLPSCKISELYPQNKYSMLSYSYGEGVMCLVGAGTGMGEEGNDMVEVVCELVAVERKGLEAF